jgi:hypothetical protein
MSDREAFEKWLKSELPEYAGDGEASLGISKLFFKAWQAAQAQAGESAQIVKPGEVGWQLREVYFDDVDGDLEIIAYRAPQLAQQVRFVAACSGLQYENPMACGEVSAVIVGEKRFDLPQPQVNQQLLEALQAVLECGSTTDQWWIDKAKAAIAAAQEQV